MELRKLEDGEESIGVHNISAVDKDGSVLARYECPCGLCEMWRAAKPMLEAAIASIEQKLHIERGWKP